MPKLFVKEFPNGDTTINLTNNTRFVMFGTNNVGAQFSGYGWIDANGNGGMAFSHNSGKITVTQNAKNALTINNSTNRNVVTLVAVMLGSLS